MGFSVLAFADTYPAHNVYHFQTNFDNSTFFQCDSSTNSDSCLCSQLHRNGVTITEGNNYPSAGCIFTPTSGSPFTFGVFSTYSATCPYGGTVSGSSCINVSPCPVGQTRDLTGECKQPPLNCGANEYDNAGVCTPIPDCNANAPLGRNFFDVETKACKTIEGVGTICISQAAPKYCPPIDDCKPSGYICSNEPNQKAIEDAARASAIAVAAASAAEKKAQLAEIAAAAAAAAATKASETQTAKDALQAAKDALAAAKASGDQAAIAAAVKEYGKALTAANDAAARQANSQAASDGVTQTDIDAGNEQAQIPSSNPGNAAGHDENIGDRIPSAITGLTDAISGDGSGTGRGSGATTSTSQTSSDTSGLATDSTLQGVLGELKGGSASGAYTKGTAPTGAITPFYTSNYQQGFTGVWNQHKTALTNAGLVSSLNGLASGAPTAGDCPTWTFDFSGLHMGSAPLVIDCSIFGYVKIFILLTATFAARRIIFGG
jgi:hypothetical protein